MNTFISPKVATSRSKFFVFLTIVALLASQIALPFNNRFAGATTDGPSVTVNATSVVCDNESLLPNWGDQSHHFPGIDSTTAIDYVNTHVGCHLAAGWGFAWAYGGQVDSNLPGIGGDGWHAFDTLSDGSGVATVQVPIVPGNTSIWGRVQPEPAYVPFSNSSAADNYSNPVSAEFYCHQSVAFYDNFDYIAKDAFAEFQNGEQYDCVSFNAPKEKTDMSCNADANLLQNGDFENPPVEGWDIIADSNPLLKWLVAWVNGEDSGRLGLELQNNVAGAPAGGLQLAELDGDHPTKIWQSVATIVGDQYTLNFKYSPRPGTNGDDNKMQVLINGAPLGPTITTDGSGNGDTVWEDHTLNFTATTPTTVVEFRDIGTDNSLGNYLDNATLNCRGPENIERTVKVTIVKYINGVPAVPNDGQGPSFIMTANTNGNIGPSELDADGYDNTHGAPIIPYQAQTWDYALGTHYSTYEDFDTPVVGASCADENSPQYELTGYTIGSSLADAASKTPSLTAPDFPNLQADQYVIVWNRSCTDGPFRVRAVKFIDGVHATKESANDTRFPIIIKYNTDPIIGVLVDSGQNNVDIPDQPYEYSSNLLDSDDTYSVIENIGTGTVSDSCTVPNTTPPYLHPYMLQGYSIGDTYAQALAAEPTMDTPLFSNLTHDKVVIIHNIRCNNNPQDGKVHIIKYIDGVPATAQTANSNSFSMNASTTIGDQTYGGVYPLGPNGFNNGIDPHTSPYQANTWVYTGGTTYSTTEDFDQTIVGESCNAGTQYALVGYTTGSTEQEAVDNLPSISTVPPQVTLDGDKYIIVWNHKCTQEEFAKRIGDTAPVSFTTFSGGGGGLIIDSQGDKPKGEVLGATDEQTDEATDEVVSCVPYLNNYILKGFKNNPEEVTKLQTFLNKYLGLSLPVDGVFSKDTWKAVKAFQEKEAEFVLKPWLGISLKNAHKGTGNVFKTTLTRINNIMCPDLNLPIPTDLTF